MDNKVVFLVFLTLLASGCGEKATTSKQGRSSIAITELSISDRKVLPNQRTTVKMKLTNYNEQSSAVNSENITLYNLGQLQKITKKCNPKKINSNQKLNPSMRCTWTIKAPGKSYIEGFKSKTIAFNLNLNYTATVQNKKAIKIKFKPIRSIQKSRRFSKTLSNGEVTLRIEGNTPVSTRKSHDLVINARNTGQGEILGALAFNYQPKKVFNTTGCKEKNLISGSITFSCSINSSIQGTRSIFVSTSYKYERTKEVSVQVVNNQ